MEKSTRKAWIVTAVILIIAVIGLYSVYSQLEQISVKETRLRGITSISAKGFSFGLDVLVDNPGWITVPLEGLDYEASLRKTGEVITSGSVGNGSLKAKDITTIPIDNQVEWIPSADLVLSLVQDKEVFVDVVGTAKVRLPFGKILELPVKAEIDVKPYVDELVKQVAPKNVAAAVESLPDQIGGVDVKEIAKQVIPKDVMEKGIPQAVSDALPDELKNKTTKELIDAASGFVQQAIG